MLAVVELRLSRQGKSDIPTEQGQCKETQSSVVKNNGLVVSRKTVGILVDVMDDKCPLVA